MDLFLNLWDELVVVHGYQVLFYLIAALPLVEAERASTRQTVYFPDVSIMFLKSFGDFSAGLAAVLPASRCVTIPGQLAGNFLLGLC